MLSCTAIRTTSFTARRFAQRSATRRVTIRNFSKEAAAESKPPSPPPPPPPSSSTPQWVWQAGTVVALVATYIGVNKAIDFSMKGDEDDLAANDGPAAPQAEITKRVFFDVEIDNHPAGRIVMGLHGNVVPRTVHNFQTLCAGDTVHPGGAKLAYEGTIFHRIIPGFMIQGGDFTNFNGTGGISVYGNKFEDENFQLRHTGPGLLSMANAGRNTNGSQFFITTARTPHLDGRHVVFGVVTSGWDVVKRIESFGNRSGTPSRRVTIKTCGVLEDGEEEAK